MSSGDAEWDSSDESESSTTSSIDETSTPDNNLTTNGTINSSDQQGPARRGRKRQRCPEKWARNIQKKQRYQAKALPKLPVCKHPDGKLKCKELSMQDVRRIHQKYYEDADREKQNQFILRHVSVRTPKRMSGNKNRQMSTLFTLPKRRAGVVENIHVCQGAFISILQVGRDRLKRLCHRALEQDTSPSEKRGGDRRTELYQARKEAVMNHIKSFQHIERHYSRGRNCERIYLSSDLNVRKMWYIFCKANSVDLQVKYDYYLKIFDSEFNIGFGAPSVDTCSTCSSLKHRIAHTKTNQEKGELQHQLTAHERRAGVFYKRLQEDKNDELTLSYDCQKNLVLPKVPDQAAYYARQLYVYNFTICEGPSKASQNPDNVTAYVWLENEFAKGSNQIASAVHHKLLNVDLTNIITLRLFSDGCGGQNKNKTMLGMIMRWFLHEAPQTLEKIILWFPIVGHSFIPPDRVFGNIERKLRKLSVIENPTEYTNIMKKFATLVYLGDDCTVHDWKTYADDVLKTPGTWHFQFQKSKKIIFTKSPSKKVCLVQGEPFYKFESGEPKSLNKRGKNCKENIPDIIPKGIVVKDAKIKDVKRLLALHYGEEWDKNETLSFFTDVFAQQERLIAEPSRVDEADEVFDLLDDDDGENVV